MKQFTHKLACAAWVIAALTSETAPGATLHVWLDSPNPVPPYDSWGNAATNIQDAVDAADLGDTVLVTNGVYATGGRAVDGTMTNRVAVDKPLHLLSMNGPEVTIIQGYQVPGTTNGDGAIRCVYLTDGASLSGFTLTNGATRISSDYPSERSGGGLFCESTNAAVTNCIISCNSAYQQGGGSYSGALHNCTLSGNSGAWSGGGAYGGTLDHCSLSGNSAAYGGGGVNYGTLYNCTLSGNSAEVGGGAYESTLNNCIVTGNSATHGGGANNSTLYNSTVTYNTAVSNPVLNEDGSGGGVSGGALYNCIVYFNTAPSGPNFANGIDAVISTPTPFPPPSAPIFRFSCTTPLPVYGTNNIDFDPQMATLTHLSTSSPCIGAGNSAYASGVDIDGEPWANPPCMGADQLTPGQANGSLTLAIEAEYTNVATEFAVRFVAQNQGHILSSIWDFDDGTFLTNQPIASHAWSAPGSYTVRLTGYNDSFPGGVTTTVQIQVSERVYYVNQGNPTPVFPYTSWATAATNIQDAIEAGATIGRLVLVTNGVYASGSVEVEVASYLGYLVGTNRMALTGPMVVRSVNGPEVTVIEGVPGIRCAYVGTNAILNGFTLTKGNAGDGGGAWCEDSAVLTNCLLTGNSATRASYYGGEGGGAYHGTLDNCTLSGNSASEYGGGAAYATLNRCTLSGNSAPGYYSAGGGVYEGTLYNCTLSDNSAGRGGGAAGGTLYNCILTGNSASQGGGFAGGDYYHCEAPLGTLYNCTVTDNSATDGGGVFGGTLYNCVVYFNTGGNFAAESVLCNTASDNWEDFYPPIFNYSCTTPLPTNGVGNIAEDPQMATLTHLSTSSPCIAAGNRAYASGVDIDGEPWADPPSMGADQLTPGQATGALAMSIEAQYTNVAPGIPIRFVAHIQGVTLSSVWDFDDGTFLTNQPSTSHAWHAPGTYTVRLMAYNDSFPEGITTTVRIEVGERVYYVNQGNPTPVFPYTSWATAATNIQDGIDAGTMPGRLVLVTNGVYASGSVAIQGTDRIALTGPMVVRSVNGPELTVIEGAPGIRCAYVGANSILAGFTLSNGSGGAFCEDSGTLTNCILTGNSVYEGGGAYSGTLYNCTVTGNSALGSGGGVYRSTLYNCTVTDNSAHDSGGGVYGGTLYNCIVYYNLAVHNPNYYNCTFNYSCTTPLPAGSGNIDSAPRLASSSHLSAQSPCIGAGNSAYASGVDIDGDPWANPPCMGADQLTPGQATGSLTLVIEAEYTNVATGFAVRFGVQNQGRILSSVWDFDDGTFLTNQPSASHAWSVPGSYTVRLAGYNDSFPEGVTTTVQIEVSESVYYVNQGNPTPVFPYAGWATASTNIQDAIDAGATIGRLVLVTNGVYASGSVAIAGTDRTALTGPMVVRSVNGPEVTVIEGAPGIRCAYVGTNAILNGFTLTNGNAGVGGGAWCEYSAVLTNCILTGNSATGTWGQGGGAYHGTLYNCTLSGNVARLDYGSLRAAAGGGSYESTLYNCTLSGNVATGDWGDGGGSYESTLYNCTLFGNVATGHYYGLGGGSYGGTLYNCIVYFNSVNYADSTFDYSCTTPLPAGGTGNITNAPVFVDLFGGNLRLQSNSPCINAGNNAYVTSGTDLDGNPRIVGGTVDMGAYEFQGSGSLISYAWLQQFSLPTDGSADAVDSDADGHTTFQEWQADTDPTNALSYFHIEAISKSSPAMVSFLSSSNRIYTLWGTPQLAPPDWTPVPGERDIPGTGSTLTLSDPTNSPQRFYRIQVNLP